MLVNWGSRGVGQVSTYSVDASIGAMNPASSDVVAGYVALLDDDSLASFKSALEMDAKVGVLVGLEVARSALLGRALLAVGHDDMNRKASVGKRAQF